MTLPDAVETEAISTRGAELPADQNPAVVYLGGLAESSRRVQLNALARVVGIVTGTYEAEIKGSAPEEKRALVSAFPWEDLRAHHAETIRRELEAEWSASTTNRTLSALRGVLKAAFRLGLLSSEEYQRAAMVEGVSEEKLPSGRRLKTREIFAMLEACEEDGSDAGTRDLAILALLYSCGLRRSEIVGLDVEHYDPESGRLEIHGAKNRKDRVVFATNGAHAALNTWLDLRPAGEGPIFTPVDRGGNAGEIRRLSENSIYYLVARRAEAAGVEGKVRPHDFRRSFAAAHLESGADLSITARIMGHSSPETTARYDVRGETEIRESMKGMTLPGFED